jgi:uncharacterized iron-regulated protein
MHRPLGSGSESAAVGLRALAALGIAVLGACAQSLPWQHSLGTQHPLVGRIYQVSGQRFVDEATLLADLAAADFVLLGERHDNRDHHRLQARLTRALQDARPRAVAFEMIPSDRQLAVVEYRQRHPRDAAGLGAALDWPALAWPAWALYEPIAQAALASGAEIVAADLSPAQRDAVFSEGPAVLQAAMVRRTGLDRDLPAVLAAGLAQELRAAHCGQVPEPVVEGMFRVQRARDAMMADRLATVAGRSGGVLIAGNGHVRKDRGVPWYLAQLRPDAKIVSVGLIEVGAGPDDDAEGGAQDALPYDYVWFTPRVDDQDPCAGGAAAARLSPRPLGPRAGAGGGSARCSRTAARGP